MPTGGRRPHETEQGVHQHAATSRRIITAMETYHAYETEAIVQPDGTIRVAGVPFQAGERVRVLLLAAPIPGPQRHATEQIKEARPIQADLRGTVYRYDDPFEPAVPPEDWEALK